MKAIINDKYFALFKDICSSVPEIAAQGKHAKSMDDVINLSSKLTSEYSFYHLPTMINLWNSIKNSSSLDSILKLLLEKHYAALNSRPSFSLDHMYVTEVGALAVLSIKKAIDQHIITGNLKEKIEEGMVDNFKRRKLHEFAIPFDQLTLSDMIPWKKEEASQQRSPSA